MDDDPEREELQILALLAELVDRSGRSQRDIERELGVGHGWLRHLFRKEIDLKVQHILRLGKLLGVSPGQFFRQVYPAVEPGDVRDQVTSATEDVRPPGRGRGPLSAVARKEVRLLFREEMERFGLLPSGEAADTPGEGEPSG